VVISDFSHVQAVAAGPSVVYAATTEGLIVYDRRFKRWDLPVTRQDGLPDAPVRLSLTDPADESLWLATDAGLAHYSRQLHQVDVLPGGPVSDLMFDRDDPIRGLFVRTDRGWEMLGRGQMMGSGCLCSCVQFSGGASLRETGLKVLISSSPCLP